MAKIIPFTIQSRKDPSNLTISDKQTIDALELLIEYMAEVDCDIDAVIDSQELGDVIHRVHILISKANGVDPLTIDFERNLDISFLYNDQGFIKDPQD